MQWLLEKQILDPNRIHKYLITSEGRRLTIEQVWNLWQHSADFRIFYNNFLAEQEFDAIFWEHPPYTPEQSTYPYEVVLVNSSSLASKKPELAPFQEYFSPNKTTASFPNRGGDAKLLVPCPGIKADGEELHYTHLVTFCRTAPQEQVQDFWSHLGSLCKESLGGKFRWLSTAGMGVYWLHVRLDARPKYYRYVKYKESLI